MKRHMNTHKHDRNRKSKSKIPEKDEDEDLTNSSNDFSLQQEIKQIDIFTENNTKDETKDLLQRLPRHVNCLAPPNVVVQFNKNMNIKNEVDQFKNEMIPQSDGSFVWNYVPS